MTGLGTGARPTGRFDVMVGVDGRDCHEVLDAPLDVGPCLGGVFFWAHRFLGTLGAEAHF